MRACVYMHWIDLQELRILIKEYWYTKVLKMLWCHLTICYVDLLKVVNLNPVIPYFLREKTLLLSSIILLLVPLSDLS
jgi:predicted transcriptional regulator